jgi:hypothetical protein
MEKHGPLHEMLGGATIGSDLFGRGSESRYDFMIDL